MTSCFGDRHFVKFHNRRAEDQLYFNDEQAGARVNSYCQQTLAFVDSRNYLNIHCHRSAGTEMTMNVLLRGLLITIGMQLFFPRTGIHLPCALRQLNCLTFRVSGHQVKIGKKELDLNHLCEVTKNQMHRSAIIAFVSTTKKFTSQLLIHRPYIIARSIQATAILQYLKKGL